MIDRLDLERLWPLSRHFEYAAEIGLALRLQHGDWWQRFAQDIDLSSLPLNQAQGFAFLLWLEETPELARQLLSAYQQAFSLCAPRLTIELHASLNCLERDYQPRLDQDQLPILSGETLLLDSPQACRGYPAGMTDQLDTWTATALTGADVIPMTSNPASEKSLRSVHEGRYLDGLWALARAGGGWLSPETWVTPEAPEAILAASGALVSASRQALRLRDGQLRCCLVHPGSHHAERSRGGGTGLVNHLAVAATDALRHGARSVAIFDIDAHHGQGTEQIFYDHPQVLTVSCHQANPFFPGTGSREERGSKAAYQKNRNIPIVPGQSWREAIEQGLRDIRRHRPDIVLVECSTDAHRADPVADLGAQDSDFFLLGQQLRQLRVPVVCELGASLAERAWVGGLRSILQGWHS